jgi:hypothetical protein
MDSVTADALTSVNQIVQDLERVFITRDSVEYEFFIQNRINHLLVTHQWVFHVVPGNQKRTLSPHDDVMVIRLDGTHVGELSAVEGTYPYTGKRRFLNELEKLAGQPQTQENEAYGQVSMDDQEQNEDFRMIHDVVQRLQSRLERYRSKYSDDKAGVDPRTACDRPKPIKLGTRPKHSIKTHANPPPVRLNVRDVPLCGAKTQAGTKCRRRRTIGKTLCSMHL